MHRTMLFRAASLALGVAVLGACDDDETTAPSASAIEAVSATTTSGPAGTVAPVSPTVRVLSGGAPAQGVVVHFAVTSGGGASVQFANVTTDASGIASAGDWRLGGYTGTHTVTATVQGLAPVVFSATVGPGLPAQVTVSAGNNQAADPGEAVPTNPVVLVRDAWNQIVPAGTVVTFRVTGGGGTIAGATQVTAITNAAGFATAGPWVVGTTPGPQALQVTAGTGSLTMVATSRGPCDQLPPLATVGSTTDGELTLGDPLTQCEINGIARDLYRLEVTSGDVILITMTGAFPTMITLQTGQGTATVVRGSGEGSIRLFVGQTGTLIVGAGAVAAGQGGDYTLTIATTANTAITDCTPVNVMHGLGGGFADIPQSTEMTDCSVPGDPPLASSYPADVIHIYLTAGQTVRLIQAPTTDLDAAILVISPTGARTLRDLGFDGGTESFVYTAATTGIHVIHFTSYGLMWDDPWGHEVGPYLMTVTAP